MRCNVLVFVPLNTVFNVILSGFTGMIVLNEGRNVISFTGISFSLISILAGITLLVSGPADGAEDDDADGCDASDVAAKADPELAADCRLSSITSLRELRQLRSVAEGMARIPTMSAPVDFSCSVNDHTVSRGHGGSTDEGSCEDTPVGCYSCFTNGYARSVILRTLNHTHSRGAAVREEYGRELQMLRQAILQHDLKSME